LTSTFIDEKEDEFSLKRYGSPYL